MKNIYINAIKKASCQSLTLLILLCLQASLPASGQKITGVNIVRNSRLKNYTRVEIEFVTKEAPADFKLQVEQVIDMAKPNNMIQSYSMVQSKLVILFEPTTLPLSPRDIRVKTNIGWYAFQVEPNFSSKPSFITACDIDRIINQHFIVQKGGILFIEPRNIHGTLTNFSWCEYDKNGDLKLLKKYDAPYFLDTVTHDQHIVLVYNLSNNTPTTNITEGVHVQVLTKEIFQSIKLAILKDEVDYEEAFKIIPDKYINGLKYPIYWEYSFEEPKNSWLFLHDTDFHSQSLERPSGITKDIYYRRYITIDGEKVYSEPVLVKMKMDGGIISTDKQQVSPGESFTLVSVKTPQGVATATWEKREEASNKWNEINGTNKDNCQVTGITGNTWFRRKVTRDYKTYYSNECLIRTSLGTSTSTYTSLDPSSTNTGYRRIVDVTYTDGFGRKSQDVLVNASPQAGSDIIQPYMYGKLGREERTYLPYAKSNNAGKPDATPFSPSNWAILGNDDKAFAFKTTEYDDSPLDRIVKITGPGKAWYISKKSQTITLEGNVTADSVRCYGVNEAGELVLNRLYSPNILQKKISSDEDGNKQTTFTTREGQVLLSESIDTDGSRLKTYYIYDDWGLLRYVLPPEASASISSTATRTTAVIRQYCYYYEYDNWGRQILKQMPGCDPVYLVYDGRDRLVMSQDGKQRAENANKWSYSLYDNQNRVIETGEVISNVASHATLQTTASGKPDHIPTGTRTPLQYTLYDTYTTTTNVPVLAFQATTGYASDYYKLVTGLVTSVKTRVLGSDTWLTTTTYYDNRCQVIQTVCNNIEGFTSRVDMKYDFTGNLTSLRESHKINTSQTDVFETVNTYDTRSRLVSSMSKLNGGTPATVLYTYDAVGRLVSRKLGAITETMTYNPRGWLTGKESVPFKMKLRYEKPEGGSTACWNGNISEWEWQQGTNAALMYGFTYDGINRLTETSQKQKSGTSWSLLTGNYLEKGLTYDRNGNIKTLQRTANGSIIAGMAYTYIGNQLTSLSRNGTIGTYQFDKNGNMINDSRKNLSLSYNVLNLLSEAKAGNMTKAKYSYLAEGTKLQVRDAGSNGFDYLGSLAYRKSSAGLQLESANFGEGVIRANVSNSVGSEVNYFLTDHLGSVRVIVDGNGVVKERNDYYPFGAKHVRSDYPQLAVNRNKYNGKEMQVTGNLDYLDYGARMYDSEVGRWFSADPLSEDRWMLTPYNYCQNNSLNRVDMNGALDNPIYDPWGDFLGTDNFGLQGTPIIMGNKFFEQGMSHWMASFCDMGIGGLRGRESINRFSNHYLSLPSRPDWDGVMSYKELLEWGREMGNAPVFLDASKIDIGNTYIDEFGGVGNSKRINTVGRGTPLDTYGSWGTNYMTLVSADGKVKMRSDRFDYDQHDLKEMRKLGKSVYVYEVFRSVCISALQLFHGVDDKFGFDMYPYGYAKAKIRTKERYTGIGSGAHLLKSMTWSNYR